MKHAYILILLLPQVWTDDLQIESCIYWTFSEGFGLPEFTERIMVNDVTVYYYDSRTVSKMPCPDWINSTAGRTEWHSIHDWSTHNYYTSTTGFHSATKQFNLTGSLSAQNIYQGFGCCFLYPNGIYKASVTHAFNGKDFISFDFSTKTLVAAVPQAVPYKTLREKDPVNLDVIAESYKKSCPERLNIFKKAPGVNIRKVPEVQIFKQKKVGSVIVTCHVTGFYPLEVQVVWLGPDLQPVDEGVPEVLPNGDGTYQARKSVIVPEEDVGKHNYSCVVLHISVPNNITTLWVEEKAGGVAVWVPILVVCILLVAAVGLGVWWWRSRTRGHDGHAPNSREQHPNVCGHPLLPRLQEQPPPTNLSPESDAAQNTAATEAVL